VELGRVKFTDGLAGAFDDKSQEVNWIRYGRRGAGLGWQLGMSETRRLARLQFDTSLVTSGSPPTARVSRRTRRNDVDSSLGEIQSAMFGHADVAPSCSCRNVCVAFIAQVRRQLP
jgi:hypothetical protein